MIDTLLGESFSVRNVTFEARRALERTACTVFSEWYIEAQWCTSVQTENICGPSIIGTHHINIVHWAAVSAHHFTYIAVLLSVYIISMRSPAQLSSVKRLSEGAAHCN